MASPTKRTRKIRRRKESKKGKKRKAALRLNGTTLSAAQLFGEGPKLGLCN